MKLACLGLEILNWAAAVLWETRRVPGSFGYDKVQSIIDWLLSRVGVARDRTANRARDSLELLLDNEINSVNRR